MSTGGDTPPTSGEGSQQVLQPPPHAVPVSSAAGPPVSQSDDSGSGIPTTAGGAANVNNVPGSQPAFVTTASNLMGGNMATHPGSFMAIPQLAGPNLVASLTGSVLSVAVGGGGYMVPPVPGHLDTLRDQQSLFSTPAPAFSMNTLLAALPSSTPEQIQQLSGILSQFNYLSVSQPQHQNPVNFSVPQLSAVVQQLVADLQTLMTSRKEEEIRVQVAQFNNPLSKRMGDAVERLFKVLTVGVISLICSGLQEMRNRVEMDLNSGKKGKGKKNKGKKKSAAEKALELKEGGGVSKPKRGACHRCGGPHFVRHCPKPIITDDAA